MFRRSKKHNEKHILDVINSRDNANRCGECGAAFPTWASSNLGVLLCGRCANCHRKVLSRSAPHGGPVSNVKSLTLEEWTAEQLEPLRRIGNRRAKRRWNPKSVPFPHDDDDDSPIESWLRDKYLLGKFRDDAIAPGDYGGKYDHYSDDSGRSTPVGRSRSSSHARARAGSRPTPSLTHRKPTSTETAQYRALAGKIMGFGFSDRDAVVESLVLSGGDMEAALDILDLDAKTNPTSAERPPDLPRRPAPAPEAAPAPAPVAAAAVSADWWTGQPQPGHAAQATGLQPPQGLPAQPQIYQYTDPVTGQVSYIDANGQQYLDPSNPQHQQMLVQQTNPQYLAQQATKQNIMSLYTQPDAFSTNVAVPAGGQPAQAVQAAAAPAGQFQQNGQYGQPAQGQYAQYAQPQMQQTGAGFGNAYTGYGYQPGQYQTNPSQGYYQ